jgi:hypothetical protein
LTDRQQELVVRLSIPLKVGAQIKQGERQQAFQFKQENEQQTPDAPVPIQKWVDGLELVVNQRQPDERREIRIRMQVLL